MKFSPSIVALAAAMLSQTVGAAITSAAAECGNLGVMEVPDTLPEGVTADKVRKCAAHPLDANGESLSREVNDLVKRGAQECETKASFGCSKGFCWKVCGPGGEWCWTASDEGTGPWKTCNTFKDCGSDDSFACGVECGEKCGCSC